MVSGKEETFMVEIHLGAPFAAPGTKCIYCGKPATRTATTNGSINNLKTGDKISFTKNGHKVHLCDEHGVIRKEVRHG